MSDEETPAESPTPADKPASAKNAGASRLRSVGDFVQRIFGDDVANAFRNRNWTMTGAAAGALGAVADITQIFGPVAAIGLAISGIFAAGFGAIVFMRLKWRDQCVNHFATALLAAGLFSIVLLGQQAANASDTGAIAKLFPGASKVQRAMYSKVVGLEEGQGEISRKIDQLSDEVRRSSANDRYSKDASQWVGTWVLESPYQPGWVVTYHGDGTYEFRTPQATVNGVYKAADGLFHTEAPGTGLSDAGAFRFRDKNTLEMTGKFGMSIWKRIDAPQPPDLE